ncbi:MAG: glycosidase [Verrucomicrobia bacterium]|nr:glycosidase [Verrucomicrobiota bacterium]
MADLACRFAANPILTSAHLQPSAPGLQIECLLNPGAFSFAGKTWLLVRVAERSAEIPGKVSVPVLAPDGGMSIVAFDRGDPKLECKDPRAFAYDGRVYLSTLSHLRLVSSVDGVHFSPEPSAPLLTGNGPLETYGVEDCRVVHLEGRYHLTYTAVSGLGVGVGLRHTDDWRTFQHAGMILPPDNKDCAIFEEKIGGRYFALHRPSSPALGGNYIWIAESPDLLHWGNHRCVATTRPGKWDGARVGAGAAPIKTADGWLEIYHGATAQHRYCLGALLLDLHEPWKVLARSEEPIMEPTESYETNGFFGHVIFTNGHIVEGDRLRMYYGAADTVVCGADFSLSEILATLR